MAAARGSISPVGCDGTSRQLRRGEGRWPAVAVAAASCMAAANGADGREGGCGGEGGGGLRSPAVAGERCRSSRSPGVTGGAAGAAARRRRCRGGVPCAGVGAGLSRTSTGRGGACRRGGGLAGSVRKVWGQASETPPLAGRSVGGRSGRRTSDDRDRRWETWEIHMAAQGSTCNRPLILSFGWCQMPQRTSTATEPGQWGGRTDRG